MLQWQVQNVLLTNQFVKREKRDCLIVQSIHSVNTCKIRHSGSQITKMFPLILFVLAFDNGEWEPSPYVISYHCTKGIAVLRTVRS